MKKGMEKNVEQPIVDNDGVQFTLQNLLRNKVSRPLVLAPSWDGNYIGDFDCGERCIMILSFFSLFFFPFF